MNTTKAFYSKSDITTDEDAILFVDGCKVILGFMHEFDFSNSENNFYYIKTLHDGTNPEITSWGNTKSQKEWIDDLQAIKYFPAYLDLMNFKKALEQVMSKWIMNR